MQARKSSPSSPAGAGRAQRDESFVSHFVRELRFARERLYPAGGGGLLQLLSFSVVFGEGADSSGAARIGNRRRRDQLSLLGSALCESFAAKPPLAL